MQNSFSWLINNSLMVVGKRYRNELSPLTIYQLPSFVDQRDQKIKTRIEMNIVFVLLELYECPINEINPKATNVDLKVLLPDGMIGWIWTNRKHIEFFAEI